jgi:hypothetical protein
MVRNGEGGRRSPSGSSSSEEAAPIRLDSIRAPGPTSAFRTAELSTTDPRQTIESTTVLFRTAAEAPALDEAPGARGPSPPAAAAVVPGGSTKTTVPRNELLLLPPPTSLLSREEWSSRSASEGKTR